MATKALGLCNISLRERSILEVSSDLGPFDYIIAHGVYSWVPPEVRTRFWPFAARIWRLKGRFRELQRLSRQPPA